MAIFRQRQTGQSGIGSSTVLVLFSVVAFQAAMRPTASVAGGLLVTIATCLIVLAALKVFPETSMMAADRFWLFAAAFSIWFVVASARMYLPSGAIYAAAVTVSAAIGILLVRVAYRLVEPRLWLSAAVALVVIGVVAIAVIVVRPSPRIDVILVNEAGAAAIADGQNPYTSVAVPSSSPFADEEDGFVGYVYPPAALVTYSASQWLLGDTRWVNVIALAFFVLLLLRPWSERAAPTAAYAAAASLAIVLLPSLGILLRYGWTEPIAFPFLIGAALNWRRRPLLAAVLLGLAFATKQYFILLAPLVIFWDDEWRWRRAAIVGGVVLATMLPFLVLDARALWDAAIAPALATDLRPDSLNVIALGIEPPSWIAIVLAVGLSVVLGRRGGDVVSFFLSSAAVLAIAFLFGLQSFSNYWWMVVGLELIAFVVAGTGPIRQENEAVAGEGMTAAIP